jgi:polyribonucleotide nucleotidyltransferase
LFPSSFRNETQVLPTVISYDKENDPEALALIASSAALAISGIPFMGPVAAAKVGMIDGEFVLNPTKEQIKSSQLELIVAGTEDAVLMVESEASGLTEKQMLDAVKFGHDKAKEVINLIKEFAKEAGKERWKIEEKDYSELKNKISSAVADDLQKAFDESDKQIRTGLISAAKEKVTAMFEGDDTYSKVEISDQFKSVEKKIVRTQILKDAKRIDRRKLNEVRNIKCEVGILPKVHEL